MKEYIERGKVLALLECSLPDTDDLALAINGALGITAVHVRKIPAADVVDVVRCKDCKRQDTIECPLVMVRFDMSRTGEINEILEQNAVGDDFGCTRGERRSDT